MHFWVQHADAAQPIGYEYSFMAIESLCPSCSLGFTGREVGGGDLKILWVCVPTHSSLQSNVLKLHTAEILARRGRGEPDALPGQKDGFTGINQIRLQHHQEGRLQQVRRGLVTFWTPCPFYDSKSGKTASLKPSGGCYRDRQWSGDVVRVGFHEFTTSSMLLQDL